MAINRDGACIASTVCVFSDKIGEVSGQVKEDVEVGASCSGECELEKAFSVLCTDYDGLGVAVSELHPVGRVFNSESGLFLLHGSCC